MAGIHAVGDLARSEKLHGIEGVEASCFAEPEVLATGINELDQVLEGGLRSGMLCEFAVLSPSSGGRCLLLHLLASMGKAKRLSALVDGSDSFDPQSAPKVLLDRLLWVRSKTPLEAMKAAGVLLRDENFGLVGLDLKGCDERQLRRIKSSDWYRLQRLAEQSSAHVCVFTSRSMIPSAQLKVELDASMGMEMAERSLSEIGVKLGFKVLKHRIPAPEGFPNLIKRAVATG